MSSDIDRLNSLFWRLPAEGQVRFLSRLVLEVSIVGRNTYGDGPDQVSHPRRLRVLNEIQHRVGNMLVSLSWPGPLRHFPQNVFGGVIEGIDDPELERELLAAIHRAGTKPS